MLEKQYNPWIPGLYKYTVILNEDFSRAGSFTVYCVGLR